MLFGMLVRPSWLLGTALLLGCGTSFDPYANLDEAESKALDRLLSDAGLDRKALGADEPKVTVSMAGGHINRLVLEAPPSAPSLQTLAALRSLESMQLVRAAPSLDTLPEDCGLVELRMASNGISDLSPLSRCASLERLWIVDEAIDSFETLPELPKLKALYVDRVALPSLQGVGGRGQLETLLVSSAGLTSVKGLTDLPSLETLNLSDNRITDASALDELGALRDVDVADNELSEFPAVVLAAEVPKIGGNPGASAVREELLSASLKVQSDRERSERKLDLGHEVPPVNGTAQGGPGRLSWAGNEVEGHGRLDRLEGVYPVKLRKYGILAETRGKRRPVDRRMTFTVKKGPVRVYFGHGPGTAASVLVEPGTPRVVRTGLAWGDRWTAFIVEAVDGTTEGFTYRLEDER